MREEEERDGEKAGKEEEEEEEDQSRGDAWLPYLQILLGGFLQGPLDGVGAHVVGGRAAGVGSAGGGRRKQVRNDIYK